VTSPIIRLIIVVAVVVTITEAIAYPLIQKYRTISVIAPVSFGATLAIAINSIHSLHYRH
jgi:uncharacterized membrane protein